MEATMSGSALLGGRAGGEKDFDRRWRQALFDGVIADMAPKAVTKPGAKFPGWTPTPRMAECPRSFAPTPRFSTGASPTTPGFRNVRSPSPRPCGATPSRWPPRTRIASKSRKATRWRSALALTRFSADAPIQWSGPGSAPALARLRPQACWRDRRRHRLQRRAPAHNVVALDLGRNVGSPDRLEWPSLARHRRALCARGQG